MKREAEAPSLYKDVIREVGAPNKTVIDNAKVLTGLKWRSINRRYNVEPCLSVPHNQHKTTPKNVEVTSNLTFYVSFTKLMLLLYYTGVMQAALLKKFIVYWLKDKLDGKCDFEMIMGETPGISFFSFVGSNQYAITFHLHLFHMKIC